MDLQRDTVGQEGEGLGTLGRPQHRALLCGPQNIAELEMLKAVCDLTLFRLLFLSYD